MMSCSICQLTQKPNALFYRDDDIMIWHCADTTILGYLMIAPIRHIASYELLTGKELAQFSRLSQWTIRFLKNFDPAIEKIYMCSFNELTPHVHFHLFPRYDWMLDWPHIQDANNQIDAVKIFHHARENCIGPVDPQKINQLAEQFKRALSQENP
ncbi:MAG: hypothetical protein A2X77_02210 [Gammaproteobacteria bacterium GWE2_42_36]|nr:MAG: hypothetical protein A2X77_02210 [Gammaproteobacteria bacterium GWE2_42_36]HCU04845.1 hypothetical protein [Coxiellaceae bacterium]